MPKLLVWTLRLALLLLALCFSSVPMWLGQ